MKNTTELREELTRLYNDMKSKKIEVYQAKVMIAATNAILKSCALEMEHAKMTGNKRDILFLTTPQFGRNKT